jgi:hypothetical protein
MEFDLDIGERLFGRFWRRWSKKQASAESRHEDFLELAARADPIAAMLAGQRMRLREAESVGGVRGRVLLLPNPQCLPAQDAEIAWGFFLTRMAISVEIWRGRGSSFVPQAVAGSRMAELQTSCAAMFEAQAAERRLSKQWPGFGARVADARAAELAKRDQSSAQFEQNAASKAWEVLRRKIFTGACSAAEAQAALPKVTRASLGPLGPAGFLLWGDALSLEEIQEADAAIAALDESEKEAGVAEDATERMAKPRDFVTRAVLDQNKDKDIMPEHVFEKIQTLEEFSGGRRRLDGADDMDDQAQALDELDLREVVRGGPEVESVYRVELDAWDAVPDVQTVAPHERAVMYDEWNEPARSYRRDWVAVYPCRVEAQLAGWAEPRVASQRARIEGLVRQLNQRREARVRERRQLDGSEIDLQQYILHAAAERAGQPSNAQVYANRRPRHRDLACSVLMDVSLSADGWIGDRRVLDAVQDAALLLGEVTDRLDDAFRLQAFASQTRNFNRVWTLKDWKDSWPAARNRLGALRTQGYTRIGPAIRHASAGLATHPARRRLLLLLTDGKPTDFDRYEGGYGRADVRQAVREAAQAGVQIHAIGFDPAVASQLGEMFGSGGWAAVNGPAALSEAVLEAYGRFAV